MYPSTIRNVSATFGINLNIAVPHSVNNLRPQNCWRHDAKGLYRSLHILGEPWMETRLPVTIWKKVYVPWHSQ